MKKVILVGPYPPPYGGVSVHIMRLKQLLDNHGYKTSVIKLSNYKRKNGVFKKLNTVNKLFLLIKGLFLVFIKRCNIIHFHTSAFRNFLYSGLPLILASCFKKRYLTIHSGAFISNITKKNKLQVFIFKKLMSYFDKIIVVNKEQKEFLKKYVDKKNRILVLPAFIPENIDSLSLNKDIKSKVDNLKGKYNKIIVTSGYMKRYYGHHTVIEAVKKLNNKDVALIHSFYTDYDEKYEKELNQMAQNMSNVYFFRDLSPYDFSYLISKCDIYIRATDIDGDAVAIREALYYGKIVIASDSVKRPDNVVLFNNGDSQRLYSKVLSCLENHMQNVNYQNNNTDFLSIY